MNRPRRVLVITPHFPPDTSAGTHRARVVAPHLAAHGWTPTILTVDPRDYEGRLDPDLAALVPRDLRVVRVRAWSAAATRRVGLGDLGLRALVPLARACRALARDERFDAVFLTIYPTYPALLGPWLKRRFGWPFVLDYQDPWVGSWGLTVGGGPGGAPDAKSRLARGLASMLEPRVAAHADALCAVSPGTLDEVRARVPAAGAIPSDAVPIGFEPADMAAVGERRRLDLLPDDGRRHLVSVGTMLPNGLETLRAVLTAVARLRAVDPAGAARLHLTFIGTSNQTTATGRRVQPIADALGVGDQVTEWPARVDYLDALAVSRRAHGLLVLGSTEPHYTASKLFTAFLAERPTLAVVHEASTVVPMLRPVADAPVVQIVTYGARPAGEAVPAIVDALARLSGLPGDVPVTFDARAVAPFAAPVLAGRVARLLEAAIAHAAKGTRAA